MAKNTGHGYRHGVITHRSQFKNPVTGRYTERNTQNGQFVNNKADDKPFKDVRKEK